MAQVYINTVYVCEDILQYKYETNRKDFCIIPSLGEKYPIAFSSTHEISSYWEPTIYPKPLSVYSYTFLFLSRIVLLSFFAVRVLCVYVWVCVKKNKIAKPLSCDKYAKNVSFCMEIFSLFFYCHFI